MPTTNENPGPIIPQDHLDRLMQKAMKEPGVQAAMDVFHRADNYQRWVELYENYTRRNLFAPVFNSCDTAFRA